MVMRCRLKIPSQGNCSASQGLPSDAQVKNYPTVTQVKNCRFALNNHYEFFFLHTLPLIIAFKLEYALFYEFYVKVSQFTVKKC